MLPRHAAWFPIFFIECHSDPANVVDERRIVQGMEQDYLCMMGARSRQRCRFGERVMVER